MLVLDCLPFDYIAKCWKCWF